MKHLRGIFEKLPGSGIWWVRYADSSGRIRREKVGTKSAALQLYRKRKTDAMEGRKLPNKLRSRAIKFSEIADDAKEYSKTHKRSYTHDVTRMKRLVGWFGERAAESITPQDIERKLSDLELKPATLNRHRALLSLTFKLATQNGKLSCNPARLVKLRRENNARLRFLSPDEEKKLRGVIEASYLHHLPELDFAIHTGLRRGEQYSLTWSCVDFERKVITIPLSKHGEHRHVPLNDTALGALLTAKSQSNGCPFVFLNRYGERLVGPREWFVPAVETAGLADFTWHCLRHTFASRLVMAGVDIRTVQELMGHKTIQMTVRYAHLAPKHQLAAVQRLCVQEEPTDTTTDTAALFRSTARTA